MIKMFGCLLCLIFVTSCTTVEVGDKHNDDSFASNFKKYSFKLYRGSLIEDNVKRLAKDAGFQIHTVNLPPGCDLFVESKVINEWNVEDIFKRISHPYFSVAFYELGTPSKMVVLTYVGSKSLLNGCYK